MKKRLMKMMVLLCVFALCLSYGSPAFAATAELKTTQEFMDFLDAKNIKYSYEGKSDQHEQVNVKFDSDYFSTLTCKIFFKDDCEEVSLRVWNILDTSAGKNYVFSTLNSLNKDYKFAKFVYDDSDSSVQAELDVYIDPDHCGRSVYDSMMILVNIIDDEEVARVLNKLM